AAGMYLFDGLTPGAYVLREVAPEGWRYGVPATGVYRVNLTAEVGATPDFGLTQRSRIDGFAFEDRNGNGVRDAVDVPLRQGGDVFADLNGNGFEDDHDPRTLVLPPNQTYGLANLSPGNYPLRIMLPGAAGLNYVQTTPPLGSAVTLGTAVLLTGVDIGV